MTDSGILILPGLDGSNLMLGEFQERCASQCPTVVGQLPTDVSLDYPRLAGYFADVVETFSTCHVIAESFSGPLGILLAAQHPNIVQRLTLVASFATSPMPSVASWLPWSALFRLPMPAWIARHYFVGDRVKMIPVLRTAICQTPVAVLRHRLRLVQTVDVSQQYSSLACQLTYLRPRHDRLIPRRCADRLASLNPATVVLEIDGPHLILETHPEKSWQTVF